MSRKRIKAIEKAKKRAKAKETTNPMKNEKQKQKTEEEKRATKKKVAIVSGSIVAFLALVYLGITWFFVHHFYLGTMINENDFGLKSVAQVEEFMHNHVAEYVLTIKETDGKTEVIRGSDISISYVESEELTHLLREQNPFLWFKALWERDKVEAEIGVQYDETQLETVIQALQCLVLEDRIESVSAHPKFEDGQYVVAPEVIGTQVDEAILREQIANSINGVVDVLDLAAEECYKKPVYVSTSPEIIQVTEELNQALLAEVTYEVAPQTEVVDAALISQWLTVDEEMQIQLNEDLVREYVETLATKYNTIGTTRTFTTAHGKTVDVPGGDFGWRLDKDAEAQTLIENIRSKEPVTREPIFSRRGSAHGIDNDYGNTYIEVDLTNQNMRFIQDGVIALETDIVTGLPSRSPTRVGSFTLTYKTRNAVLRAPLRADGTREYETPVAWWMPFDGGIGFHDATWQPTFGGNRYRTNGSHGCINMPLSKAEELYYLIQDDTPIIVHN